MASAAEWETVGGVSVAGLESAPVALEMLGVAWGSVDAVANDGVVSATLIRGACRTPVARLSERTPLTS